MNKIKLELNHKCPVCGTYVTAEVEKDGAHRLNVGYECECQSWRRQEVNVNDLYGEYKKTI